MLDKQFAAIIDYFSTNHEDEVCLEIEQITASGTIMSKLDN